MKTAEIKVFGVEGVKYDIPTDINEMAELAGKGDSEKGQSKVFDLALKQVLYHSSFGAIRAKAVALLSEEYGAPKTFIGRTEVTPVYEGEGDERKLTGYTDAEDNEYPADSDTKTENEKPYFDRIVAESGKPASAFRDILQAAASADECKFDPSVKQRGTGVKKIAKTYLTIAKEVIDGGGAEALAAQLSEILGTPVDVSDEETRLDNLARAISDNEARERAEQKNKYKALAGQS